MSRKRGYFTGVFIMGTPMNLNRKPTAEETLTPEQKRDMSLSASAAAPLKAKIIELRQELPALWGEKKARAENWISQLLARIAENDTDAMQLALKQVNRTLDAEKPKTWSQQGNIDERSRLRKG